MLSFPVSRRARMSMCSHFSALLGNLGNCLAHGTRELKSLEFFRFDCLPLPQLDLHRDVFLLITPIAVFSGPRILVPRPSVSFGHVVGETEVGETRQRHFKTSSTGDENGLRPTR